MYLPPASRNSDPISSYTAEDNVNQSGARLTQAELVLSIVRAHPGRTSKELALFCKLDRHQIARRLPDLQESGLVFSMSRNGNELTWHPATMEQMRLI